MRNVLANFGKIFYRHRAHLNTLRQGRKHLPRNQETINYNSIYKHSIQSSHCMRLQTNGWTPQLVPRPDFDSPFRSEYVSGQVRAPSGTSGLDYSLKFERGPSSTSNQTHKVINTIQHQLIPRSTPTASIARGRAGRVPAFQHPAL